MPATKRPAAAAARPLAAKAARSSAPVPAKPRVLVVELSPARAEAPLPHATKYSEAAGRDVDSIAETLHQVDGYPLSVLSMLASSLSHAAAPTEHRHPSQDQVLDMVQEVLDAHAAAARGQVKAAEAAVEAITKEREARQQVAHESTSAADDVAAALTQRMEELAKLLSCLATAKGAQSRADSAEAEHVRALETVSKSRASLLAVQERIEALRRGSPEPRRFAVSQEVLEALKAYSLDASLILSLTAVLAKEPVDVTAFDNVVIDQLEAELAKLSTDLEVQVARAEEAREHGLQDKLDATAKATAAEEKAQAAAAAVEAARGEVVKQDEVVRAAAAALEQEAAKADAACAELNCLKQKVEALEKGVLRKLHDIRGSSIAPKPELGAEGEVAEHAVAPQQQAGSEAAMLGPGQEAVEPPQALGVA